MPNLKLTVEFEGKHALAAGMALAEFLAKPAFKNRHRPKNLFFVVQPPKAAQLKRTRIDPGPAPYHPLDEVLTWRIEDLDLDARSSKCLLAAGIGTISQLVGKKPTELLRIRNFGHSSLEKTEAALAAHGQRLKGG